MAITIKAARVNAGLTQVEASNRIGVSRDVISNWERGITVPNANHIRMIETVYGVGYSDLIFLPNDYAESVGKEE